MAKTTTIRKQDMIVFARQLALVVDSDVSIHIGLGIINEKSNDEKLKIIIERIQHAIIMGDSLSEALSKEDDYFPKIVQSIVKIGEESGELASALNQIADNYESELETSSKIRAAVTYPIILSSLMIAAVLVLIIKVLPMFNGILASFGGEMPLLTQTIMAFSNWIGQHILAILIVVIVLIAAITLYFKSEKNKIVWHKLMFKLPIIGQITAATTAVHFARNMAMLIKSGISVNRSSHLVAEIFDNRHAQQKISKAAAAIDAETPFEIAVEKLNLFPSVLIKLLAVAGSTGHIDLMLEKAAQTMEQELNYRLERLTTVIEPILIIFISLLVGLILIAVILPIIDIMNAIG